MIYCCVYVFIYDTDSNQDNYRGRGDKEPECILEIKYGVSSTAKNVEFAVFQGAKGLIDANGDNAFGGGNYRCYSDDCKLNCQIRSSCNDAITYLGTKPIMCTGDCTGLAPSSENKMPFPIMATPDINGDCVINPKEIIATKSDVPIVFPNKCETATLNCVQYSGICEEREIYCSPDEECKIICGGPDPLKPGELITGACKLATMIIGPPGPNHILPRTINEAMLDVDFESKPGKDKLKATLIFEGKESCGKCTVDSVLTDTVINANGPNTFTEGLVNCGFNPDNIAVNRAANKGSCDLVCTNVVEPACDKCAVALNSIAFNSIGANCDNVNYLNRMKSINGDNDENNLDKTSIVPDGDGISNKQIWAIIVTLSTILIIVITIMCVYYRYESSNIVSEKTGLITDDNNREMINMDIKY